MGLVITRRDGESFDIKVAKGTTPDALYKALEEGILVTVIYATNQKTHLSIEAPKLLTVQRSELGDLYETPTDPKALA